MSGSLDAGRFALAGFLYQLVGSVHHALKVLRRPNLTDDSCAAEFALEIYGQDAGAIGSGNTGKALELIQYKYSGDPSHNSIDEAELIEILQAFRKSKRAAKGGGYIHIGFRLVTNRPLDDRATTMASKAASGELYDPLDKPKERKIRNKVVDAGRGPRINPELRAILKALTREPLDEAEIRQEIKKCASDFGLIDGERAQAISRLVDFALGLAASANNRFKLDDILEHLANFPQPRSLLNTQVREMIRADLENFRSRAGMQIDIIRRSVLDQIGASLSHALIVVVGSGGTGKTVILGELIKEVLESGSAVSRYLLIDSAYRIETTWLASVVSRWRNSREGAHTSETTDRALARLEAVGIAERPLVIMGLDAIDEVNDTFDAQRHVQTLLEFFIAEERDCRAMSRLPRATMIVTCRDEEELNRFGVLDRSGFGALDMPAAIISIGVFSEDETLRLINDLTTSTVADRLRRQLAAGTVPVDPTPVGGPTTAAVEPEIHEAIRHPVLWRCFSQMNESDQHRALSGEPEGLNELARRLVEWFCKKTQLRLGESRPEVTRAVLIASASRFQDPSRVGRRSADWVQAAIDVAGCAPLAADRWFREATSSGLVEKVSVDGWRWRHRFVCEYLRSAQHESSVG
jgi:hypothetical protein